LRRLAVRHQFGRWTVEERWTSVGLKPYFNDFVVHDGHAFASTARSSRASTSRTESGSEGGRTAAGSSCCCRPGLLLVLSEQGELALVRAAPDEFTELGHFPAIKGKNVNHPVLAGDLLLVRNGQEMAAFRLALQKL